MALTESQNRQIRLLLKDKILTKLRSYNPETQSMPFHVRLLGKDKMAVYSFIQSINTMLGSSIFEQVAAIVAKSSFDVSETKHRITGGIREGALFEIDRILTSLRESSSPLADERDEDRRIRMAAGTGKLIPHKRLIADLFTSKDSVEYFFEIKTVKPNIDVFIETKRKMLKWKAARYAQDIRLRARCFIAFPYNPEAPKPYNRWTLQGLYDVSREVLVAEEFWDFLGGYGVYSELLDIFKTTGIELRDVIDRKFNFL